VSKNDNFIKKLSFYNKMSDENYEFVREEEEESEHDSQSEHSNDDEEEEDAQRFGAERDYLGRAGNTYVAGGKDHLTKIKDISDKYLSESETSKLLSFLSDEKKLRLDKKNPEAIVCGYILFANNFSEKSFKLATSSIGDNVSKADVIKYAYFWKNVISKLFFLN